MKTLPWYIVAGNHDHEGNVTAQIEYSKIDPTKRWNFPDEFYTKSFTEDGISVDVIMIDTAAPNANWQWIENQFASKADYVFVGEHYPVYSVCQHGPTQTLITNLQPLLQKYNAHYLSGHDHW